MRIKVEISDKEKKWLLIGAVILIIVIYFINRRYLYILEAQFDNDGPEYIILKVGFLLPMKKQIDIIDGNSGIIRLYGYKYKIVKNKDHFDLYLNGKKTTYSIYNASYYDENHGLPTGRIYLRQ